MSEQTPTPTTAALVPVQPTSDALTRPAASQSQIVQAFHDYQDLQRVLLVESDYQTIQGRKFPKKSAWRKLGVAFGVSAEIVSRDYERDEDGKILRAEVVVRAIAPNGRYVEQLGSCDLLEKCTRKCEQRANHDPADHFSHPQHDIPATASTRATNRAFSDLFGMGEVSAEEVLDAGPAPQWQVLGWPDEAAWRDWNEAFRAWAGEQGPEMGDEFREWREANGITWPARWEQSGAIDGWAAAHGAEQPAPSPAAEWDESPFLHAEDAEIVPDGTTDPIHVTDAESAVEALSTGHGGETTERVRAEALTALDAAVADLRGELPADLEDRVMNYDRETEPVGSILAMASDVRRASADAEAETVT